MRQRVTSRYVFQFRDRLRPSLVSPSSLQVYDLPTRLVLPIYRGGVVIANLSVALPALCQLKLVGGELIGSAVPLRQLMQLGSMGSFAMFGDIGLLIVFQLDSHPLFLWYSCEACVRENVLEFRQYFSDFRTSCRFLWVFIYSHARMMFGGGGAVMYI